ncbi:16566_t:CDS:2, partial [Cetraspora pellucida]
FVSRNVDIVFSLISGWAFKEVQKFEKKDFAQDMYQELQNYAQKDEINTDEVPKLIMI